MGQGHTECAFGTGNALLRYGIDTRCSKQPPVVRDAFSEALGVKNRLFWYGRDIRCTKTPFCGTRRIFRGPQNSRLHRLWTASCPPDAFSKARSARTVAAACVYCGGGAFFKKIKKEDVFLGKVLEYTPSIKLYDLIISPEIWRPAPLQDVR